MKEAAESDGRPTLVCFRTKIGYGSPHKEGTAGAHGAALGEEEVALTRKGLNWDNPAFEIDKEIYEEWDGKEKGQKSKNTWEDLFEGYVDKYAEYGPLDRLTASIKLSQTYLRVPSPA